MTIASPDRAGRGKSVAEIEHEIDCTRAELGAVLDAIERRFAPRQLLERGADMLKETLSGGGDAVGETLRNHPVPLTLIGAGIGWLLVEATVRAGVEGVPPSDEALAGYAYARTKTQMGAAARTVDTALSRARERCRRAVEGNPLALGVVGLLAGAALALLLPRTKFEERWLGEPAVPTTESPEGA